MDASLRTRAEELANDIGGQAKTGLTKIQNHNTECSKQSAVAVSASKQWRQFTQ